MNRAAFTAALASALRIETGRPGDVGKAPLPAGADVPPEYPYWVLHPIPGGGHNGPPQHLEADASWVYQVTYVGLRADQLEQMADRGRTVILGRETSGHRRSRIGAPGVTVMDVELDGGYGGVAFDGPVGNLAERFVFHVTSS